MGGVGTILVGKWAWCCETISASLAAGRSVHAPGFHHDAKGTKFVLAVTVCHRTQQGPAALAL